MSFHHYHLPQLPQGTSRSGRKTALPRNSYFRSNQIVRDHVVNFTDSSLTALTLKEQRKKRPKQKPKHKRIGDALMKQTLEKNISSFERRAQKRARLLRKQRIVFLFTRIQSRAVEKIQTKVRDFLEWRQQVRRDEASRFIAEWFRRLKKRRLWREMVSGAGLVKQRVLNGVCRMIQRSTRKWLWKKARTAALKPLQRLVHSHLARQRTARLVQQRYEAMARRLGRWIRAKMYRRRERKRQEKRLLQERKRQQLQQAARKAYKRRQRSSKRLQRKEISKNTYARKQFLLRARAQHSMTGWLNSRGLCANLEKHPELRDDIDEELSEPVGRDWVRSEPGSVVVAGAHRRPRDARRISNVADAQQDDDDDASADDRLQTDERAMAPDAVQDWVDFFMTNEHCKIESAKIRGLELTFNMLEKARIQTRGSSHGQLFSKVDLSDVFQFFRLLDSNRDGQVSQSEFQEAMSKLGEDFSDEEVEKLFAYVDTNDSGGISVSELQAAMAVYQRKYAAVAEREDKLGPAKHVMKQIYAQRLGGHVKDELNEAIQQGSMLAASAAQQELEQLRKRSNRGKGPRKSRRRRRRPITMRKERGF